MYNLSLILATGGIHVPLESLIDDSSEGMHHILSFHPIWEAQQRHQTIDQNGNQNTTSSCFVDHFDNDSVDISILILANDQYLNQGRLCRS